MDDKKDKKQYPQVSNLNNDVGQNSESTSNEGVFRHLGISDKNFVFQYKKTEKILAALYLVTNFLSTQEPLRWEIRELSLSLLSNIMSLKDALPSQKDELCKVIKTSVLEIIALLEIAHFAGFISNMNFEILKKEFVLLLDSVSSTKQSLESFILPNNFFNDNTISQVVDNSTNLNVKDRNISTAAPTVFKGQKPVSPAVYGSVEVKKNNRQHIIIDLLKKKKEIMVKDVALLIKDCSEKTLQRELLSMVEKGVLKKEGERRWSKYSLA